MDNLDPSEKPNLNTGTPWSSWDDQDIRCGLDHNRSIEETADFLCRTPSEVRQRIREITEADAIGDSSLLRDGLTHRDRIALETYRDARAAMALIREAVEDCAPPGSVTREGYLVRAATGRTPCAPICPWPWHRGSSAIASLKLHRVRHRRAAQRGPSGSPDKPRRFCRSMGRDALVGIRASPLWIGALSPRAGLALLQQ
jgi:hypothetical protein